MSVTSCDPNDPSLALLTDLYQLSMAYGYWKLGMAQRRACFHLFFRSNPFNGGYTLTAGLQPAMEYFQSLRFEESDLAYLTTLTGNDGRPLLDSDFLAVLRELRWTLDIDAMPEGTIAFPYEPVVRVTGGLMQCQLLETMLLTHINFQSLIATKASRVCYAAGQDPVIEFGLRRAQGPDGGLSAARATCIGGCEGTANVLAGKRWGIPVRGTHAHSWVMAFDSEAQAFEAYARVLPNNCIFLVDTYNTLEGVRHAAEVGKQLRSRGHRMIGIRLDSGDLAYLSIQARRILDDAGLPEARILASNDLDEHLILSLKQQGAKIDLWGVGTRLVTGHDCPALGGIFKLSAIERDGRWQPRLKISEQSAKTTVPGVLQVRRYKNAEGFLADMIYDTLPGPLQAGPATIVDPVDPLRRKTISAQTPWEDLLVPVWRQGRPLLDWPSVQAIRERAQLQLRSLHPGIRRFEHPHAYPAGLHEPLYHERLRLAAAQA